MVKIGHSVDKEQQDKDIKKEKGGEHLDPNALLNLVAYPISAGAGYYAAKQNIRKDSVEWHTKHGAFDAATHEMTQKAKAAKAGGNNGSTVQELMAKIREEYEEAKSAEFVKMGYKSVTHNWKDLADNSKMEAVSVGFTVAFISLGALLTLANRKEIFKPLFKKDGEDKNQTTAK